jgi:hypothetical protein
MAPHEYFAIRRILYLRQVDEGEVVTRCCTFRLDPQGVVPPTMRGGATFELTDARGAVEATWHHLA